MAIDCLFSEVIIEKGEYANRNFKRIPIANYFSIKKGRFRQFFVNLGLNKRMTCIPKNTDWFRVSAEKHAYNICYTVDCLGKDENNLKTYSF